MILKKIIEEKREADARAVKVFGADGGSPSEV